ncbi:MAG: ATP-binding protein, partial [Chloroflexota bacterium]
MQNIRNIGTRFSLTVAYRLGYTKADPSHALLRRFADYFLADVIRERAKHLARGDDSKIEQFRSQVDLQYLDRLKETALVEIANTRAAIEQQNPDWLGVVSGALDTLENNLDNLYLPYPLSEADLKSRSAFAQLVRRSYSLIAEPSGIARLVTPESGDAGKPSGYARRILYPEHTDVIAGVLLRSAQRVVLNIIQDDYVTPGKRTEVPDDTERVIQNLLARFEEIAERVRPYPPLAPRKKAEAGMRVVTARAEGHVWLPLRPIPTAPLPDAELEQHYVGRPDAEAARLARQIRHADGAILVSGYRGVGKSSFVNRVLFHVQRAQAQVPEDSWLVVPITISLAKVAGVENVLRTTLRSVRNSLLNPDATPRSVLGLAESRPLPLRPEEITRLEEAYLRATWKVTLSRANTMERKWEMGSSVGFDLGKALSPLAGWELGKFLSAEVSKSRAEKVYREVSLLNYDENAAEDDLATLIHGLASHRPLYPGGPEVRVKLVFVFDELDKMDVDKGLMPMIEGLKNLFLQQHAVFILVTNKKFYYDLLKHRAIEDATLNSYFSAIVHVPLLTFAQARRMLEDWIDWEGIEPLKDPNNPESKLLDQLARFLTYRSFGNPREIVRELRQMQEWTETREQPYLTDRLAALPGLRVYAAMQEAI